MFATRTPPLRLHRVLIKVGIYLKSLVSMTHPIKLCANYFSHRGTWTPLTVNIVEINARILPVSSGRFVVFVALLLRQPFHALPSPSDMFRFFAQFFDGKECLIVVVTRWKYYCFTCLPSFEIHANEVDVFVSCRRSKHQNTPIHVQNIFVTMHKFGYCPPFLFIATCANLPRNWLKAFKRSARPSAAYAASWKF